MKTDWQKFNQLWQAYQPLCLSLMHRYYGESKEDVHSELKVIFFELLLEYEPDSGIPLAGYLKSKLTRRLYNHLRKFWLRQANELLSEDSLEQLPADANSLTQPNHLLQLDFSSLTQQQRTVLQFIYEHGYSERETAAELQLSYSRIHKIKKLALARLKKQVCSSEYN